MMTVTAAVKAVLGLVFAVAIVFGAMWLIAIYVQHRSYTCTDHGGAVAWPWWQEHPAGVLMCADGVIVGPPDAIARCYAAHACVAK
jgi:hypothetical protein